MTDKPNQQMGHVTPAETVQFNDAPTHCVDQRLRADDWKAIAGRLAVLARGW